MPVQCRDLLKLPALKGLRLLAGSEGLSRVVTWPYIGGGDSLAEWARGGELLFVMDMSSRADMELFEALVLDCDARKLAGMILTNASGDWTVAEGPVKLADKLGFPLMELPGPIKVAEVMKEIGNYIIKDQNDRRHLYDVIFEILYGTHSNMLEIEEQARFFGFDLNAAHQAGIIHIGDLEGYAARNGYGDDNALVEFKNYVYQVAQSTANQHFENVLTIPKNNNEIVLLIPVEVNGSEKLRLQRMENLCTNLMRFFSSMEVHAGVGRVRENIWQCKKSLKEAEQAVRTSLKTSNNKRVTGFDELDIFRIFFQFPDYGELEAYVEHHLNPLLQYDRDNNGELIKTLQMYFECKLNLNQTAKGLFIHRNSLMYRFKRIEELTERSLDEPNTLKSLFMAIILLEFLHAAK